MTPIQLQYHANEPIPPMPTLPFIQKVLARKYGARKAVAIAARIQANYAALFIHRPVFKNHALNNHVDANILPGLALYQTFLADRLSREVALNETRDVLTALTNRRMTRRVRLLARLPGMFWLLRRIMKRTMNTGFVEPGFKFHWVADNPHQIAFTMTRCLYHNTLTAYGAPELTPVFCYQDDVWGVELAPKVIFERPQTIGRGGQKCNFCYRLSNSA